MKIAIIISSIHRASEYDIPGKNVKDRLIKHFNKTKSEYDDSPVFEYTSNLHEINLYTIKNNCTNHEHLDQKIEADLFIFPTTHTAASGKKSLCVHTQGNWGTAELGGQPNDIASCPANWLKAALQKLNKNNLLEDYDIVQEATHHGPSIEKPCMFIEIGSSLKDWDNPEAADILSKVLLELFDEKIKEYPTAIGIGGTHYLSNFLDIQLNSDVAVGHVCPKYALEFLDEKMINLALERTFPIANLAVLDWKGLGSEKERIVNLLTNLKIEFKKTKELKTKV